MNQRIFSVAVGLIGLGCCAPLAQARSLSEIRKTKEIRACVVPLHPAFLSPTVADCKKNCSYEGPVIDDVENFAKSIGKGIKVKYVGFEWDEQFYNKEGKTVREDVYVPEGLASGKCDFYPSNLTKNEWRLKKMDFVILFTSRMLVIVNKGKKQQFKVTADLGGKTALTQKDTSFDTWLQSENKSTYKSNPMKIVYAETDESLKQIDEGKADFTIMDSDMALWATKRQTKNSTIAFAVGDKDEIGWAFRKEDKDLQAAVQTYFDKERASKDSGLNKIYKKWFGMSFGDFISLVSAVK